MRRVLWGGAILVGVLILLVGVIFGASETGEVVVLVTRDGAGQPYETRLWVVEWQGREWLRSGVPDAGWLQRLEAQPEVEVTRGGTSRAYRAVPVRDPESRDHIHALMREKHGSADWVISLIRDGDRSVPVRLDPLTSPR